MRWPHGFRCPRCEGRKAHRLRARGLWQCARCRYQASLTAGTPFQGTRGAAYCWGRNDDASQLGDDSGLTHRGVPGAVAGSEQFVALSAGALSTCGRTATNEAFCWGGNYYGGLGNGSTAVTGVGHPVRTMGGPFTDVGSGQGHSCGIGTDRRLWCWGDKSGGQF